ncbi:MAG TPA: hypothetical protein VJP77_04160 [Planctomycetota bacterium]|nr:hypothetical protein [Planctomycetota bacterium]
MRSRSLALALLSSPGLAAAASGAPAQSQVLIAEGDVLPGVGVVRDVFDVAIDDASHWAAAVWIENTIPQAQALVVDGQVLIGPGDPLLGQPAPHVFRQASSLHFDESGELLWISNGYPGPISSGDGAYRGLTPLLVVDQPLVAPGVPPGSPLVRFYEIVPAGPGEVVVHLETNHPVVGGLTEDHLVRVSDQPGGGVAVTVIAKRGDVLPGQTSSIVDIFEHNHALGVDGAGNALFLPKLNDGTQALYLGQQLVAETGDPTPQFGLTWTSLVRANAAVNATGDVAFTGRVNENGEPRNMLVWNGQLVVKEGDSIPAVAPFAIEELFAGDVPYPTSLHLTDTGGLVWFAGWDDPDTSRDRGVFVDLDLVLREGDFFVEGLRVVDLVPANGITPRVPTYDANSDATEFALRATLEDGRIAALRVDLTGAVAPIPDCIPNLGTLVGAPVAPGDHLTVTVGDAQAVGAVALLALSTATVTGAPGCGVAVPGLGEQHVSLSPAHLFGVKPGAWPAFLPGGTAPVFAGSLPDDPSLAGFPFYAQAVWIDPAPTATEPLRATHALAYTLGL